MATWLAVAIGGLYTAGIYMMLRRSLFKVVIGLVLLSHGANLLIFAAGMVVTPEGQLVRPEPPLIPVGADGPPADAADPLPQALILTAIVIGFGVLAFTLVLFQRTCQVTGSEDADDLRATEL